MKNFQMCLFVVVLAFINGCAAKAELGGKPTTPQSAPKILVGEECNPALPQDELMLCKEQMLMAVRSDGKPHFELKDGNCVKEGVAVPEYLACLDYLTQEERTKKEAAAAKAFISAPGGMPGMAGGPLGLVPGGRVGRVVPCTDDFASRSMQHRVDTHLMADHPGAARPGQMLLRVEGDFFPCNLPVHRLVRTGSNPLPVYMFPVGVKTDYILVQDKRCSWPNPPIEAACNASPSMTVTMYMDMGVDMLPRRLGSYTVDFAGSSVRFPNPQGRSQTYLTPGMFN